MRPRIKQYTLCSHTAPDGTSQAGEEYQLRKKFSEGSITKGELKRLCLLLHTTKVPDLPAGNLFQRTDSPHRVIMVWGKPVQVTEAEYSSYYRTSEG